MTLISPRCARWGCALLALVLHWQATKHHHVDPGVRHHVDPRVYVRLGLWSCSATPSSDISSILAPTSWECHGYLQRCSYPQTSAPRPRTATRCSARRDVRSQIFDLSPVSLRCSSRWAGDSKSQWHHRSHRSQIVHSCRYAIVTFAAQCPGTRRPLAIHGRALPTSDGPCRPSPSGHCWVFLGA